ncbi:MAG: molybdopterin-dependent oxidoreductase [Clostridiales Family XIII bacterium]|nr:molybdopterin-dependent oxidoreductase [Clostridiales Family XIII bacterium]
MWSFRFFGSFFKSPESWTSLIPSIARANPNCPGADEFLRSARKREDLAASVASEYEALFFGTDAEIYVPLWASACRMNGDALMDETTLELILFCRQWGFEPPEIQGNPPDFIGDQLAFLEYLRACALHARERGEDTEIYERAETDFKNAFLADTVSSIGNGIAQYGRDPIIRAFAELLTDFVSDFEPPFEPREGAARDAVDDDRVNLALLHGRAAAIPTEEERTILTSGVNNCGGRCVLRVRTRAGCVLEIDTDDSDRDPQLRACLKGRAYRRTYFSAKKRLRYPMKRVGKRGEGKFTRISWDEAADLIGGEWRRIRDAYGPASRFVLVGTGNEAVLRGDAFVRRLLNLDGGCLGQYGSYSAACVHEISPYIYGDLMGGHSADDLLNTKFLLLWGNNPIETFFGTERVYMLTQLKKKGVRIVAVDPRCSDSVIALADEWIGIRPSTDGAMADAMAYVILTENLHDADFLNRYTIGFDAAHMPEGIPGSESCAAYLLGEKDGVPKTPEWAERICGVPAETIARIAREYATAKPACLLPGLGVQRTGNGEQSVRTLALLCAMTGNVGIPGGSSGADIGIGGQKFVWFPELENPVPAKISCFLWSKAIDDGPSMTPDAHGLRGTERLEHGIKMLFCIAGNLPMNQHSNINETKRILSDESKCEFILCSDVFMTPSARFADVLLPAAAVFEVDNFTHSWGGFGYYLLCNNKAAEPLFESRFEWEWVKAAACRLGYEEVFADGKPDAEQWRVALYEELRAQETELPPFERFCEDGGYSYRSPRTYVAYAEQRQDPENRPFATPSGKIELYSERIAMLNDPRERPPIPRYVPCFEGYEDSKESAYPLQLIGWHTKRRSHSIHDHNPWLEEAEPQRVWINPADAEARNIADGDEVEVFNERGRIRIKARVTSRVIRGVAAMAQGAWYTPDKDGTDVRGCINVLTSTEKPTPYAKGNPQHTNLAEIRKTETPGNS